MIGYTRPNASIHMKAQQLLSDEIQMKNLGQRSLTRNGQKLDIASVSAPSVSSIESLACDKTPTNSPLLVSNGPQTSNLLPPIPPRQDSILTPGFPTTAGDVPTSVAPLRPSLANSVIYEMVETDFNHFTVVPEMKLTTGVINKFNKLCNRSLQPLFDSLSTLHGTASGTTNCSVTPVQVENNQSKHHLGDIERSFSEGVVLVTSADESSNVLLPAQTSCNHRRKKSLRHELEQHIVEADCGSGSSSIQDLCPVEHRNSENNITSQAADFLEEMGDLAGSLLQVQESLKKKEEEVKQLIESFHSERETLNATCGQLNQERFKLKRDNRALRDTVRKLEAELQAMRRNCKCGCVPTVFSERPTDSFNSRNPNKSIKVDIPTPYNHTLQSPGQFSQIYRGGGESNSSSKQSSSSIYSEACVNGSIISSNNPIMNPSSSNDPKSDPQLSVWAGDTESFEEYEEAPAGSSSYSGNTDGDSSSTPYICDSFDTVNKFSSSSTGSSALIAGGEVSQVYAPSQNPILNRQRSASAEQLVQPFPTNAIQHAILNSGTPKIVLTRGPSNNPSITTLSSPNLEPFLKDVKRENSGKMSPSGSAESFRKLSGCFNTGLVRRASVLDLSVSDEFSRSSGYRESALDVVMRHKVSVPIDQWPVSVLLDWLRLDLILSKETVDKFQQNVKDVPTFLALKSADLKVSLGLDDKFQRKRLARAINFFIDYPHCKDSEKADRRNLLKLDCDWMAGFFLEFVGLPEYNRHFLRNRIDGLTMSMMNGEDVETIIKNDSKSSKSNKNCAISIWFGWQLMRIMKYNTQKLEKRMLDCRNWDIDPLVWSNDRFYQWLKKQNFEKEANNLTGLGIHGPLLVLSKSFTKERLFEKMKLRNSKESLPTRTNLQKKLESLLSGPRSWAASLEEVSYSGQKEASKSRSVPTLSA